MDFSLWSILETKVCATSHKSVDSLTIGESHNYQNLLINVLKTHFIELHCRKGPNKGHTAVFSKKLSTIILYLTRVLNFNNY